MTYSATTGLLTGIDDFANGTSIDNLAYTYDPLGRISTFTSVDGTATYGYDHTSQLVSATYTTATGGHQPSNISFTWDANGNNAAPGNVVSPNNEVTNDGTFTYTFDANGNRTSRARISDAYATDHTTTYTWDYRNRLTDVEYFDNNGVLTKHVHYVYDTYDNLIEEDIDPTGQGTYTTIEQFTLDVQATPPIQVPGLSGAVAPSPPADTLAKFVNGSLAYRFLNGPSPSGADVIYGQEGVDSLTAPGTNTWVFVNNLGSPTDIANSSGSLLDHIVDSVFGQTAYESDSSVFHLQGFSGGMVDPNTGLIKFGDLRYDPATGTWLSQNRAGVVNGDSNLSRYASDDPVNGAAGPQGASTLTGVPAVFCGRRARPTKRANINQPHRRSIV